MYLFIKLFAPRIIVDASPTLFTIKTKDNSFSIQPSVSIVEENRKANIIAIGEHDPELDLKVKQIGIFDNEVLLPETLTKSVLFQLFFEYCIGKIFQSRFILIPRPVIFILGSNRFNTILCGFQKDVFENALFASGASKVFFDRTEW